jgi:hypothetical protein
MKSVYCAVRTGSLNKAVCASYLKGLGKDYITKSTGDLYVGRDNRYVLRHHYQTIIDMAKYELWFRMRRGIKVEFVWV